jgi:hypothetical protein
MDWSASIFGFLGFSLSMECLIIGTGGLESLFRVSYFPPPNLQLFDEGGRVG